jgi:protocatechuate 3,4-dioxygenase beta subunit
MAIEEPSCLHDDFAIAIDVIANARASCPTRREEGISHMTPKSDLALVLPRIVDEPRRWSRRVVLRHMGSALVAAPLVPLMACASTGLDAATDAGGADTGAGGGADAGAETSGDAASIPWASGGTAAMKDKASYPNPFAAGAVTACALTCEMTAGPCYSSQSEVLQDISYGYAGLPTRMYFQVLNDACQPVAGALVDVWHVSAAGKYSGDDAANENVGFCTGNDGDFMSHLYFRGKQTTDANGLVFFDSCFPGWYAGRTIHVHLTISIDSQQSVTTQLFFDDALDGEIIGTQPLYDARGARDTTNTTDSVIAPSAVSDYLFQTRKMTDGAMLAWKTLVVRSSTSTALCQTPAGAGAGGPGGDGGAPPD